MALLLLGVVACSGGEPPLVAVPQVERIEIDPASLELEVGERAQLRVVPISTDGARMTWVECGFKARDPMIATVDREGDVAGVFPGETSIGVSCAGENAAVVVRVMYPAHLVTIDPDAAAPLEGDEVDLVATAFDEFGGELPERRFEWTSTRPEVAEVGPDGRVRAVRAGSATIVAATGSVEGTATVTVRAAAGRVEVEPSELYLRIGRTETLRATVYDARGRKLEDRELRWSSSDPERVSVDDTGKLSGLALGVAEVVAEVEGVEGRAEVTVRDVPATRIEILPPSPRLFTGETLQLEAVLYDRDGAILRDREVSWELTEPTRIASLEATGVVAARRPGRIRIRAITDAATATAELTVLLRLASVSAGDGHTCGLSPIGEAWCWGTNEHGQLGQDADGPNKTSHLALPVATELLFETIAAGGGHTCALTHAGEAWCWGRNDRGQLGDNSFTSNARPVRVESDLTFRSIWAGRDLSCGAKSDGELWCWGRGTEWQLGNDWPHDSPLPTQSAIGYRFDEVSLGDLHACGVEGGGELSCWGYNDPWGLGSEWITKWPTPVEVDGGGLYRHVAAGMNHTCALDLDGAAWCWGDQSHGSLGDGYVPPPIPGLGWIFVNHPTPVLGGLRFVELRSGGAETCGLDGEGAVWCWGFNVAGLHEPWNVPTRIETEVRFSNLSKGLTHTCGVTAALEVYCWGVNTSGEIGQPLGHDGGWVPQPTLLFPEDDVRSE